jgi:hypothetical protein
MAVTTFKVLVLLVFFGWPKPEIGMAPKYIGDYALQVPPSQEKFVDFPVPDKYSCGACRVDFTWLIVKPTPSPRGIILKNYVHQMPKPFTEPMASSGQAETSMHSGYAVLNTSRQNLLVQFHFVAYGLQTK